MRSLKVFICLLLVLCLSVLPFIQRVHAVVTVTTVVGVLILTVLAAMGITLVVKDVQKEAFVLQKGDSFMQSKGYAGSFADWISGGTDVDVALKTGFLVLAKPVVDRIKEFVAWLVPGAASDTVVDINSGSSFPTIDGFQLSSGYVANGRFIATSLGQYVRISDLDFLLQDDVGYSSISFRRNPKNPNTFDLIANGWYSAADASPMNYSNVIVFNTPVSDRLFRLCRIESPFSSPLNDAVLPGTMFHPGIYFLRFSSDTSLKSADDFGTTRSDAFPFLLDSVSIPSSDQAIIGDYDDLSQIQEHDGDNKFYITQDGQALNPSSDDLADIIGALQQSLDDINRKLDVMPWTAEAAEAGTVKPDYTDFQLGDLDFTSLGALITTRFPFSIPWDMVRVFQLFVAEPVAPKWEVDLLPIPAFEGVDTTVTLDLGQYPIVGQVSRWFCIIDLCLGLVFVSKKLIWTA